ncbi:hypothetical protein IPH67_04040 [bacterium]|nr:MAG: hypothetical protein IPH67_04040 [bacterium]
MDDVIEACINYDPAKYYIPQRRDFYIIKDEIEKDCGMSFGSWSENTEGNRKIHTADLYRKMAWELFLIFHYKKKAKETKESKKFEKKVNRRLRRLLKIFSSDQRDSTNEMLAFLSDQANCSNLKARIINALNYFGLMMRRQEKEHKIYENKDPYAVEAKIDSMLEFLSLKVLDELKDEPRTVRIFQTNFGTGDKGDSSRTFASLRGLTPTSMLEKEFSTVNQFYFLHLNRFIAENLQCRGHNILGYAEELGDRNNYITYCNLIKDSNHRDHWLIIFVSKLVIKYAYGLISKLDPEALNVKKEKINATIEYMKTIPQLLDSLELERLKQKIDELIDALSAMKINCPDFLGHNRSLETICTTLGFRGRQRLLFSDNPSFYEKQHDQFSEEQPKFVKKNTKYTFTKTAMCYDKELDKGVKIIELTKKLVILNQQLIELFPIWKDDEQSSSIDLDCFIAKVFLRFHVAQFAMKLFDESYQKKDLSQCLDSNDTLDIKDKSIIPTTYEAVSEKIQQMVIDEQQIQLITDFFKTTVTFYEWLLADLKKDTQEELAKPIKFYNGWIKMLPLYQDLELSEETKIDFKATFANKLKALFTFCVPEWKYKTENNDIQGMNTAERKEKCKQHVLKLEKEIKNYVEEKIKYKSKHCFDEKDEPQALHTPVTKERWQEYQKLKEKAHSEKVDPKEMLESSRPVDQIKIPETKIPETKIPEPQVTNDTEPKNEIKIESTSYFKMHSLEQIVKNIFSFWNAVYNYCIQMSRNVILPHK